MSFVRLRLSFQNPLSFGEIRNCWFLVDTSVCRIVADLEYLIQKRFELHADSSKSCLNLYLDDYLLPSQEKIGIIQDRDNIRVENWQQSKANECEETGGDRRRKRSKQDIPRGSRKGTRGVVFKDSEENIKDYQKVTKKHTEKVYHAGTEKRRQSKKPSKKNLHQQQIGNQVSINVPQKGKSTRPGHGKLETKGLKKGRNSLLVLDSKKFKKQISKDVGKNAAASHKVESGRYSKDGSGRKSSSSLLHYVSSHTINKNSQSSGRYTGKRKFDDTVRNDQESSGESSSLSETSSSSVQSGPSKSNSKTPDHNGILSKSDNSKYKSAKMATNYSASPDTSGEHNRTRDRSLASPSSPSSTSSSSSPSSPSPSSPSSPSSSSSSSSSNSNESKGKKLVNKRTPSEFLSTEPQIERNGVIEKTASSASDSTDENKRNKQNNPVSSSSDTSDKSEGLKPKRKVVSSAPESSYTAEGKNVMTKVPPLSSVASSDVGKKVNKTASLPSSWQSLSSSLSSPLQPGLREENEREHTLPVSPGISQSALQEGHKFLLQNNRNSFRIRNEPPPPDFHANFTGKSFCSTNASLSRSHIRFNSDDEDAGVDNQVLHTRNTESSVEPSVNTTTKIPNRVVTGEQSELLGPVEQNSVNADKRVEQEVQEKDYSQCCQLYGPPRTGDKIAYKILELSSSYTPEISHYKEATVLGFDPNSGTVELELTKESLSKSRGDGNVTGKFELVYEDEEDNSEKPELDPKHSVIFVLSMWCENVRQVRKHWKI